MTRVLDLTSWRLDDPQKSLLIDFQGLVQAPSDVAAPGCTEQPIVMGRGITAVIPIGSYQFEGGENGTGDIESSKYARKSRASQCPGCTLGSRCCSPEHTF